LHVKSKKKEISQRFAHLPVHEFIFLTHLVKINKVPAASILMWLKEEGFFSFSVGDTEVHLSSAPT
jgi:hypothetical protein